MQIKPQNVLRATYCPAFGNVNGDGMPAIEFKLWTGGLIKISVSAATIKATGVNPTAYSVLDNTQIKAALSNIDKEGN